MKEIIITDVRPYLNKKTGKQMFAFNQGTLHLSYAQLNAAGVLNPALLQGTSMFVDFFQKDEVLLNGDIVRDDNTIVKSFIPEVDKETERAVAIDMAKERANSWKANIQTALSIQNTRDAVKASAERDAAAQAGAKPQTGAPKVGTPVVAGP